MKNTLKISLKPNETSNEHIAWSHPRDGGYMCTPLVYQALVYIVKFNGVVSVYDAKTGEKKYQDRFAGGTSAFTASPVAANGSVYFANEDGQVFVVKAGPAFEIVATNDMGSPVLATPAISEGRLFIRTASHLGRHRGERGASGVEPLASARRGSLSRTAPGDAHAGARAASAPPLSWWRSSRGSAPAC